MKNFLIVTFILFGFNPQFSTCRNPELKRESFLDNYFRMFQEVILKLNTMNTGINTDTIRNADPMFIKSEWIDSTWTMDIALGDIDADGDPDALMANMRLKPFCFWINDGKGNFHKSIQEFPISCHGVSLADFDGDKDLDAFIIPNARNSKALQVWMNDGNGNFIDSKQRLGNFDSGLDVDIADLDQDGDLDAYVQFYENPNEFYINDGKGNFSVSNSILKMAIDNPAYIVDINGDSRSEIIVKTELGIETYFLQKNNLYEKIWTICDTSNGFSKVCFLDYDLDGDQDMLIKTVGFQSRIWNNLGEDGFKEVQINILAGKNSRVVIPVAGDFNNDQYPDVLYLIQNEANQIWINDKMGGFRDSGLRLDESIFAVRAAISDLDRDGDQDIFIVSGPKRSEKGLTICPNQIWLNQHIQNK